MSDVAMETRGLSKNFGALQVTNNVNFTLELGARHALIGPNGAGKTTFLNLVTGVLPSTAGQILLGGVDITSLGQAQRVKRGLARTFQINTLFRGLTVLENVTLAVGERHGVASSLFRPSGSRSGVVEESYALLEPLGIADDALRQVRELAYGKQRLVEMAIALGLNPKVLLLDEPAAGVPSSDTGLIIDVIERLPADIAILVIEHDMDIVFRIARRITVLVQGAVLVEGTPAEIQADKRVQQVYLGERDRGGH